MLLDTNILVCMLRNCFIFSAKGHKKPHIKPIFLCGGFFFCSRSQKNLQIINMSLKDTKFLKLAVTFWKRKSQISNEVL